MTTRFLFRRFLASQTAGRPNPQPNQYRSNLDNLSHLSPGRSTNTKRPATPPPPRVQAKPAEPHQPAVDKQASSKQADGTPPTLPLQKGLYESIANLNEYQKLYFALGWFAFALAGVYATYKLEEAFPLPKRPVVVGSGGGVGSSSQVEAKSQFDLLLAEETEAQLQAEAGTS
ncbi:hypothetical protein CcCBS67573_g02257 [Chytriomyces confervae]|uniref:Uncharacterized protein n=1 Tax=Chytriomyces confervae TaxID=246404 RepID=A0A507FJQ9_9FUNG|nr:hypothetical protein CcCBS67573_g02257 [Chytriomyces confervae]